VAGTAALRRVASTSPGTRLGLAMLPVPAARSDRRASSRPVVELFMSCSVHAGPNPPCLLKQVWYGRRAHPMRSPIRANSGGHDQSAHNEGVEQDSQRDDDAQLGQHDQRQQTPRTPKKLRPKRFPAPGDYGRWCPTPRGSCHRAYRGAAAPFTGAGDQKRSCSPLRERPGTGSRINGVLLSRAGSPAPDPHAVI